LGPQGSDPAVLTPATLSPAPSLWLLPQTGARVVGEGVEAGEAFASDMASAEQPYAGQQSVGTAADAKASAQLAAEPLTDCCSPRMPR
jgi:hypothetical protein